MRAERTISTIGRLLLISLFTATTVFCDVIFTSERCDRRLYGLQIVAGDPGRYKQCGPSGRVWIVPCAPAMTFDAAEKVCKERETNAVDSAFGQARQTDMFRSHRPQAAMTAMPAAPAQPEEFVFSTVRPKRPRIRTKTTLKPRGKIRKTTTPTPMTTPYTTTSSPTASSHYIPPTAAQIEEFTTMQPQASTRPYRPAFTPPHKRVRTTTALPNTAMDNENRPESTRLTTHSAVTHGTSFVPWVEQSTSLITRLPEAVRTKLITKTPRLNIQRITTPFPSTTMEVDESTIRPEYTVKYNGVSMTETEFLQRLMNMVKEQKVANEERERLEVAQQRERDKLEKQHEMERAAEKQREIQKEEEAEKQRQLELEKQRQLELEMARMTAEKMEKERLENKQKRAETQRKMEEERREQEKKEKERREKIEKQRQEKQRIEKQRKEKAERAEFEKQRQYKMEKQREMEAKRLLELEKQRQLEAKKQRQIEAETQRQLEREQQRQQEAEKQMQLEQEQQRQQEAEKQRKLEAEKEKQRQIEYEREETQRRESAKLEEQRREMEQLLERERQSFNRLGQGHSEATTTESSHVVPMFPKTNLPSNLDIIRFPPRNEPSMFSFTAAPPPPEPPMRWVTSENSWRPNTEWNNVEEYDRESAPSTSSPKVYDGCIVNGDCPLSYDQDTLCHHPDNPSAYLQCAPMYGRRGRWTERFCPDTLVFVEELARCEKSFAPTHTLPSTYNPDRRVVIPRLPTETNIVEWQGNRVVDPLVRVTPYPVPPHSNVVPEYPRQPQPEYPRQPPNPYQSQNPQPEYPPQTNYPNQPPSPHIFNTIDSFPRDLLPNMAGGGQYQTVRPIEEQYYGSRTTPEMDENEVDLSLIHPLFPRVQPSFLNRFLPFRPLRDDEKRGNDSVIGAVMKPVIKQIALDQTKNFLDRLLADEQREREAVDRLRVEGAEKETARASPVKTEKMDSPTIKSAILVPAFPATLIDPAPSDVHKASGTKLEETLQDPAPSVALDEWSNRL